jgi:hypothetical protein
METQLLSRQGAAIRSMADRGQGARRFRKQDRACRSETGDLVDETNKPERGTKTFEDFLRDHYSCRYNEPIADDCEPEIMIANSVANAGCHPEDMLAGSGM